MLIHEMTRQACIDLLARTRLYRLACAQHAQPYIIPVYCAYDGNYLYSFSTVGQKIIWMRENSLVCVEADELVSPQEWTSVIVWGKYEELPDRPAFKPHRQRAHHLLQVRPVWWEPGYAKTVLGGKERPLEFVYFRIQIQRMSGHRGVPNKVSDPE